MNEQVQVLVLEKIFHLRCDLLHRAVAGKKDKCTALRSLHEARDPFRKRFAVTLGARVGHFAHDVELHLFLEIKGAPELQCFRVVRADAAPKISEIGASHCERRAGHDAAAAVAKEHSAQNRRDVDRRGVEREILLRFAGPLDPVNVFLRALLQENPDPFTRVADPAAELLQLCLEKFVLGLAHHFADPRLQAHEAARDLIVDHFRLAHAILAAFFEIRALLHRGEKAVGLLASEAASVTPAASRVTVKRPFLVRAL